MVCAAYRYGYLLNERRPSHETNRREKELPTRRVVKENHRKGLIALRGRFHEGEA